MARFNQLVAIEKVQSHTVSSNNKHDYTDTKPERNILKILPIIPSSTSQNITYYSFLFSYHITHYFYFILFALLFCTLRFTETRTTLCMISVRISYHNQCINSFYKVSSLCML